MARIRKSHFITFLVILLIVIVGTIATQKPDAQSTGTHIPPTPTLTFEQQIQQIAQDAAAGDHKITIQYVPATKAITVNDDIGEQWDNGAYRDVGKLDIFNIQQALWQSHLYPNDVLVTILGPLLDKYGKSSTGEIMHADLQKDAAHQFVWDNLDSDSAWQVYDDTWMLPDALKN